MQKSMLDLDVFRNGKNITVPVPMQAYRRFLYGPKDTTLDIDLDKGNVDALCVLAEDGFYQPLETDFVFIEFNGGEVQFKVIDIEYKMFPEDWKLDEITNDSDDDLIRPHALIKFKLQRISTPEFDFNYNDFNPATKAILDGLRPSDFNDSARIHHIAYRSIEPEEYVTSIPGDVLWAPGIPCSFKFTVSQDGRCITLKLISCTPPFEKKDTHKILATLDRVNDFEKSVNISLNDDMVLVATASKSYPSAVEVSAGSTEAILADTHHILGKVFEFIYYGLEIGAL